MNKKKSIFIFITAGLLLSSCNESNSTEEDATINEAETVATCVYSYDNAASQITFTAYKFLNKTGVRGEFSDFEVTTDQSSQDKMEVLENLSFKIPVSSLNTKDDGRDAKIIQFFFGTINTDTISGKVIDLEDNKAIVEITMNGITKTVDGNYSLDGNHFDFNAEIDVVNWNAQDGITALNEECKDLHTDHANGDKESKLWSEVSIGFSTDLTEECN